MARANFGFINNGASFNMTFKGSEAFCREVTDVVLATRVAVTEQPSATVAEATPQTAGLPCATPAAQPPICNVTLKDGEEIQVMELGVRDGYHQFILVDCLKDEYAMNPTDTTEGGYDACELRKKLNGKILDRFPDELRAAMVPFENGDLLKLPSQDEIFGASRFECMKRRGNRVASQGKEGPWEWYWMSDIVSTMGFADVSSGGNAGYHDASNVGGVRPRFQSKIAAPLWGGASGEKEQWIMTKTNEDAFLQLCDSPEQKRRRAERVRRDNQLQQLQEWLLRAVVAAAALCAFNLLAILL